MNTRNAPVCPRCGHLIPNDETPGEYPGAMSRTPGRKMLCSPCGTHEGLQQFTGHLTPESEWPVEVPQEFYTANSPAHWEKVHQRIEQERAGRSD